MFTRSGQSIGQLLANWAVVQFSPFPSAGDRSTTLNPILGRNDILKRLAQRSRGQLVLSEQA